MISFGNHLGPNYNPEYLASLSDEELINLIDEFPDWDLGLIRNLVWRASCKDDRIEDLRVNDKVTMKELIEMAKAILNAQEKENTNMKTAEEMIAITKEQYVVAIRTWATDTCLYDLSCMNAEWKPDEDLNKAAHSAHEESELYYELLRKFGLSSEELDDVHNRSLEIISEVTRKMNEAINEQGIL